MSESPEVSPIPAADILFELGGYDAAEECIVGGKVAALVSAVARGKVGGVDLSTEFFGFVEGAEAFVFSFLIGDEEVVVSDGDFVIEGIRALYGDAEPSDPGEEHGDAKGNEAGDDGLFVDQVAKTKPGGEGAGLDGETGEELLEVFGQGLCGGIAFVGSEFEAAQGDGFEIGRDVGVGGPDARWGALKHIDIDGGVGFSGMGRALGEEFEEDDSERVDIGGGTDIAGFPEELFGGHVLESADHRAVGGIGSGVLDPFGDAEVGDAGNPKLVVEFDGVFCFGGIGRFHQDIGGFEIAMDDSASVGVLCCFGEAEEDFGGEEWREGALALRSELGESGSIAEGEDDGGQREAFIGAENGDQVGMIEFGCVLPFANEALH